MFKGYLFKRLSVSVGCEWRDGPWAWPPLLHAAAAARTATGRPMPITWQVLLLRLPDMYDFFLVLSIPKYTLCFHLNGIHAEGSSPHMAFGGLLLFARCIDLLRMSYACMALHDNAQKMLLVSPQHTNIHNTNPDFVHKQHKRLITTASVSKKHVIHTQ